MESENFSFVYVADEYMSSLFSGDWKIYLVILLLYLALVATLIVYCCRCLISNSVVETGYYYYEDDIELGLRATTMPIVSGDDQAKDCFVVPEDLFPVVESKKGREGGIKGRFEEPCMICMDDLEDEDQCRVLPCSHVLHVECSNKWWSFIKDIRCPICRSSNLVNI